MGFLFVTQTGFELNRAHLSFYLLSVGIKGMYNYIKQEVFFVFVFF